MAKEISIVAGDPLTKVGGASFTCFVLPFRYDPSSMSPYDVADIIKNKAPRYTQIDMCSQEWIKRQRYFTSETARVLYEHAKWFELKDVYWEKFEYPKSFSFYNEQQDKIVVRLHPPKLALFEWHDTKISHKQKNNSDLFHTGFLILEASFPGDFVASAPTYSELLYFNELFRYWRIPFEGHQKKMSIALGESFNIEGRGSEALYFDRWKELLRIPLQLSDEKLCTLFPRCWGYDAESWWRSEAKNQSVTTYHRAQAGKPGWICYADDRAFVWSCVIVDQGAQALAHMGDKDNEPLEKLGAWIKLLNVDPPGNVSFINDATPFEQEWVGGRSYDRWLHFGTLYGFNYHAGVMLTAPCEEPPITHHFHNMYFDMTLLLLYLRITLFCFSNELTQLSADMRRSNEENLFKKFKTYLKHRRAFRTLRREFAVFTNLFQFPLISNQQQAIEMYALIRERMDVQELFKEVEEEIKSSHEYFQFEEESMLNKNIFWLTVVGVPIAFIGTIATILSIKEVMDYLKGFL